MATLKKVVIEGSKARKSMISLLLSAILGSSALTQKQQEMVAASYKTGRDFDQFLLKSEEACIMISTQPGTLIDLTGLIVAQAGQKLESPATYCNKAVHERYKLNGDSRDVIFLEELVVYNDIIRFRWDESHYQPTKVGKRYLVFMNKWDGKSSDNIDTINPLETVKFDLSKTRISSNRLYVGNLRFPWVRQTNSISNKEIMLNLADGCLFDEETAKECIQVLYSIRNPSENAWMINDFPKYLEGQIDRVSNIWVKVSLARLAFSFGGSKYRDLYYRTVSSSDFCRAATKRAGLQKWFYTMLTSERDYVDGFGNSAWSKEDPVAFAKAVSNLSFDVWLMGQLLSNASKTSNAMALDIYASLAIHSDDRVLVESICKILYSWTDNPNLRVVESKSDLGQLKQALRDIYPNAEKIPPIRVGD